jgi:di/tricarboxylate transporter
MKLRLNLAGRMIDMASNKKIPEIYILIAIIGLLAMFIFGMIDWVNHPKKAGSWTGNMYYLCICSTFYMCGVVFFMMSETLKTKTVSFIAVIIFGWNMYVEIFGNPTKWSNWDKTGVTLSVFCACIVCFIIEKIKSLRNE